MVEKKIITVPKEMQGRYKEISNLIIAFCNEKLNEEYKNMCCQLCAALCRKRPSPLLAGKVNTWACGIIHAIGMANFLFDSTQKPYVKASEIYSWFGIDEKIYEDECDFEEWEGEADFYNKGDWDGLVKYRKIKATKYPHDIEVQWRLGEAYVLNKEYDKAIDLLIALHNKEPEDPNIQHSLLDALFESGKDENYVKWIVKPEVLRLSSEISDFIYGFLKKKRKPRIVYELYLDLYYKGFPAFDAEQLKRFLIKDSRFVFDDTDNPSYDCTISTRTIKKHV